MEAMNHHNRIDAEDASTPIGIVQSRNAFLRDLPTLLSNPMYDHWAAAYCGEERIGIAESEIELVRECKRRGLRPDQYYIGGIYPHATEVEELRDDEEIKGALSFVEYDDDRGTFTGPTVDVCPKS